MKNNKTQVLIIIVVIGFIISAIYFNNKYKRISNINSEILKYGELNPNAPKETLQFGQLVGNWQCIMSNRMPDDTWNENRADWKWTYILNGYAIQDFWLNHADTIRNPKGKDLYGTNIRIYSTRQKKWLNSWTENGSNSMTSLWEASANEDGSINMHDGTGNWVIKFYNIKEDSFDWVWDFKQEDGTMKTMSKIKAVRID